MMRRFGKGANSLAARDKDSDSCARLGCWAILVLVRDYEVKRLL